MNILWVGDPPPPAWRRRLAAAGIAVRTRKSDSCVARVVSRQALRPGEVMQGATLPLVFIGRGRLGQRAQEAVLRGAYDAFSRDGSDACERLIARLGELETRSPPPPPAPEFITVSAVGRRLLEALYRAAQTAQPVLLTGETGTGKEVAARLLHRWSSRRTHRFVPINCAAIPNDLMEAELFGYARGAFSGAVQRYDGQLMAAQGGTVFLDEVDDTPPTVQTKLLRVLEDRVVSRLGENEWHQVDFRLIAATNRDLRPLIASGQVGADLFERLATVSIQLPPLRERTEDLPALVEHLIARFYSEEPTVHGQAVTRVTPEALIALGRYPWPGNIRELRNVIYNALVGKRAGQELLLSDLPPRILSLDTPPLPTATAAPSATAPSGERSIVSRDVVAARIAAGNMNLRAAIDELEQTALTCALARADGSAAGAARLLGAVGHGRSRDPGGTVRAMLRRHGLSGKAR